MIVRLLPVMFVVCRSVCSLARDDLRVSRDVVLDENSELRKEVCVECCL